jgi:hypothetical protein
MGMRFRTIFITMTILGYTLSGCKKTTESLSVSRSISIRGVDSISINPVKILVDASRDGGVWWFPQSSDSVFSSEKDHQGKALADYLVSLGYLVDELPRGTTLTDSLLRNYNKIIRAGGFGVYSGDEILAYDNFLNRKGSLLLLEDFVNNNDDNSLAEHLGVKFEGEISGTITRFTQNAITKGVTSFPYLVGSVVTNASNNPNMMILGSFDSNYFLDRNNDGIFDEGDILAPPVMGILYTYPNSRIFFLGEINGLESIPQPFTQNLFTWLFQ